MNAKLPLFTLTLACLVYSGFILLDRPSFIPHKIFLGTGQSEEEPEEERNEFTAQRIRYEYDMIKDGGTGKIPAGIREREIQQAYRIPVKESQVNMMLSPFADNQYIAAGPNNIGGRTRAVVFDKRFGTGTNKVIIAGAVSGGIFRSTDGGSNWTLVTPPDEIHNVTAIAQDTRAGFENNWYAGGGEPYGNSASPPGGGAFYNGYGLMKSTDNGLTWNRITSTFNGTLENFDDPYDIVHKIVVSPVTGYVYVAAHRRIMRSTDNGSTFSAVFIGTTPAAADYGQLDIVCTSTGRLYLAVNGGFPDKDLRGLFYSDSGNTGTWTRFAGGQTVGTDSLDGWRANSYTSTGELSNSSKRIVLALAPSNNNLVYALYENGLSQAGATGKPEADLFKFDFGASTYANLSANMPDFNGQKDGIDPLTVQGGYDLTLAIKPDNPSVIFIGGTNLYRSTSGFTNTTATSWIAGYKYWGATATDFKVDQYDNTHPDIHNLVFDPSNPSRALCATDGGLHLTENIMGNTSAVLPVTWTMISNYQTTQYYHVHVEQRQSGVQANNFIGGMQDNSSYLRVDGDNAHVQAGTGDGGAAAISKFNSFSDYTLFITSQTGSIARLTPGNATDITPGSNLTANPTSGYGEFITYFGIDNDNPEDLYYVNYNRVFRTKNSTAVTPTTWTELTGIGAKINPTNPGGDNIGIRAIEISRGPYLSSHVMYIGTNQGRVYRLNDPRNAAVSATPVDITPPAINTIISNTSVNPTPTVNVSDIAVNPNNDDEIMVVYSNYQVSTGSSVIQDFNIWWTTNGKSSNPTWKLIEGNLTLPSIRSCAIVTRKDGLGKGFTEYYVGTSVGLYSTLGISDTLTAGKTITWKREGSNVLGYALVTSLSYRPQDNTLLVGTHGNGMYYTVIPQANYTPNINTATNDPVRNNKDFIRYSWPGITNTNLQFKTGDMYEIKKLVVQVHNENGQLVYKKETGYTDGNIDVSRLAKGVYILSVTSSDFKQQFIRKFIRQ
ncbi:T9SS type A sorting domain-containing protein [Flavihumibacter profundi]|uniref:T9SS type A sorting domain-containing protein n=1 Tax=Flavihumibacter profundi TaxID=2716883 RepID=UPI001CC48DD1|nr:T9SS type A sorting domain-containing protein [Flavihumibacter profundi]MBZ5858485.1 T9SS type A sorting domain-containing protein [Flavihumibacter profundi]